MKVRDSSKPPQVTQLAIGGDEIELVYMVANLMHLGYEPDGDSYITADGYHCQPMSLRGAENERG